MEDSAEMNKINRRIENEIQKDRKMEETTIKLLLLGAAESGKSTILKQMKIIHDNGFAPAELVSKREIVYANVLQSIIHILNGVKSLNIEFSKQKSQAVIDLLGDKGVQVAMSRKSDFYLPDCAEYFLNKLNEIFDEGYIPSAQDVLHTRVATLGVIEVMFRMKNKIWRVFDVGGQRSQRKKWIHCFDDVKAIIYVVALSEFDQVLLEDMRTNRTRESLQLFDKVCNNEHFLNTNIILFLNKKDIFLSKINAGRSLRIAFPEYKGKMDYDECASYIQKKFLSTNKNPNKSIYCHQTCATDTQQVEFVLDSTMDTILSAKLKGCGLY